MEDKKILNNEELEKVSGGAEKLDICPRLEDHELEGICHKDIFHEQSELRQTTELP